MNFRQIFSEALGEMNRGKRKASHLLESIRHGRMKMKEYVGIWIDHKKAFIVSIVEDQVTISNIASNVDGHIRLSGGSRASTPYGPQEGPSEGRREERRRQKLRQYYKKIIRIISDAEETFIFGPGEAKTELTKEMKKSKDLSSRIVGTETTDKMTEPQIKARVKEFFMSSV